MSVIEGMVRATTREFNARRTNAPLGPTGTTEVKP